MSDGRTDAPASPDDAAFDEIIGDPVPDAATNADAATGGRRTVWRSIATRNRALWITAAVAVIALVGGLLLGRFVMPAASAAAEDAPAPGLVTVPVAFGALSNDVTIRGDVGFADPVEVKIDTSAISGPAVVTGQVPEVGAQLSPLSVALEVAGEELVALQTGLQHPLRLALEGRDAAHDVLVDAALRDSASGIRVVPAELVHPQAFEFRSVDEYIRHDFLLLAPQRCHPSRHSRLRRESRGRDTDSRA